MTCKGKDAVISGECLVQWRELNPTHRQQGGDMAMTTGPAKPKTMKVCINRKTKAASEQALRKQLEDSVRREFASSIKPYRSRFSNEVCKCVCFIYICVGVACVTPGGREGEGLLVDVWFISSLGIDNFRHSRECDTCGPLFLTISRRFALF